MLYEYASHYYFNSEIENITHLSSRQSNTVDRKCVFQRDLTAVSSIHILELKYGHIIILVQTNEEVCLQRK